MTKRLILKWPEQETNNTYGWGFFHGVLVTIAAGSFIFFILTEMGVFT